MKAYFSIIIFAVLVLSSVVAGTDSYMEARGRIASDLDRALAKALAEKGQEWITADTVRVCRQLGASSSDGVAMLLRDEYFDKSLSIPELRGRSYVSLTVLDEGETVDMICRDVAGICGDTMVVSPVEDNVAGCGWLYAVTLSVLLPQCWNFQTRNCRLHYGLRPCFGVCCLFIMFVNHVFMPWRVKTFAE